MASFLGGLPQPPLFEEGGRFTAAWAGWLSQAQTVIADAANSGPTTTRPTKDMYIGKPYFDTTLGIPIWLKTPGAVPVWVNAAGGAV